MILTTLLKALALSSFLPATLACSPPMSGPCQGPKELTIGSDGPPPPETVGFKINHFALLVNDLAATRHFYGDILGMRHIFTYKASERYTIMYMGHQQRCTNSTTGAMTGCEMFTAKNRLSGLIEFVHFEGTKVTPPSLPLAAGLPTLGALLVLTSAPIRSPSLRRKTCSTLSRTLASSCPTSPRRRSIWSAPA